MSLEGADGNVDRRPAEAQVLKEVTSPLFLTNELIEKWGDGIPTYTEADPNAPEWKATPLKRLDLSAFHLGDNVYIKDESDRGSNPTGTIKDRPAWELATLYRDYARAVYLKMRAGTIQKSALGTMPIPRLSLITAGNEGRAVAECFARYDLPPPKLIIGTDTKKGVVDALVKLRADVYAVDLTKPLTPEDILHVSHNAGGIDITSTRAIEPASVFYDWHVHEVFNEQPDEIYVPYGSGRLMENYLVWQERTIRNDAKGERDKRLDKGVNVKQVIGVDVFGAEPATHPSVADKLSAQFKPFLIFRDDDVRALRSLEFTGKDSGTEKVEEGRITEAYEILTRSGIEAEPSAAAGLALYIDRYEKGFVRPGSKSVVVNTGRGLV